MKETSNKDNVFVIGVSELERESEAKQFYSPMFCRNLGYLNIGLNLIVCAFCSYFLEYNILKIAVCFIIFDIICGFIDTLVCHIYPYYNNTPYNYGYDNTMKDMINQIFSYLPEDKKVPENRKDNNDMFNFGNFFNGMFAPIKDGCCKMAMNGKIAIKGLYSEESGRNYDATVCLDDTGKYVNYKLEFAPRKKNK